MGIDILFTSTGQKNTKQNRTCLQRVCKTCTRHEVYIVYTGESKKYILCAKI